LKDAVKHTSFNLVDSYVNILRYCRASFEHICGGGAADSTVISEGPISVSANQKILKVGNNKKDGDMSKNLQKSQKRGNNYIFHGK